MARSSKPVAPPANEEQETQDSITTLVKLLLELRGPKKVELAKEIGIPPESLSHSLADPGPRQRAWRAHDVKQLALYYQVPTDAFFGSDEDARREVLDELKEIALMKIDEGS